MGNILSADDSYYNGFAEELNGKFQRLKHLTQHNTASGNYHEEILKVVLRNFLTSRYSVKTGFIYKEGKEVSRQLDIIIVDESSPAAYIFQEGDFVVVMPEAVVAVIEVKTTLDSTQYGMAVENIKSAKKLFEHPTNHPGIIFGYQSSPRGIRKMNNDKLHTRFTSSAAGEVSNDNEKFAPDVSIWLNDNFSSMIFDWGTKTIGSGSYQHSFINPKGETGWQLSILLSIIISACEQVELSKTGHFGQGLASRLLELDIMEVSDESFKWGYGKVRPKSK
jgi:hypothetical protein